MKVYLTPAFIRAYKKLIRNNPLLEKKIKQKINIFIQNPQHPSLKLHKLIGGLRNNWSFSIEKDLRIILTYSNHDAILVDMGKHEDVY